MARPVSFAQFVRDLRRTVIAAGGTGPNVLRCPDCGVVMAVAQYDTHECVKEAA